jgi:cystathionine beta-lyase
MASRHLHTETDLVHLGRPHSEGRNFVNPAVQRGSTVLFPTLDELVRMEDPFAHPRYGRQGTPTHRAFEAAVTALEHGYRTFSAPSGLAAITLVLTAFTKAGSHILVSDNVYSPTRDFCTGFLARFGVETEFFDPTLGAGLQARFRPETALVFMESPGSLTFEITDIPAIAAAARAASIPTAVDNTWATPLFFNPLDHGADMVIHAATKYILGHADGMLGTVTVTEPYEPQLRRTVYQSGSATGPEDAYLGLRGLRTLSARLDRHQANGLALARWLQDQPIVERVLHPALPGTPGHDLWARDFKGACGLFSFCLKPVTQASLAAMVESLQLFGMGFSWGGYESLITPETKARSRSVMPWPTEGVLVRVHAGLENADDLIDDMAQGMGRLQLA